MRKTRSDKGKKRASYDNESREAKAIATSLLQGVLASVDEKAFEVVGIPKTRKQKRAEKREKLLPKSRLCPVPGCGRGPLFKSSMWVYLPEYKTCICRRCSKAGKVPSKEHLPVSEESE